MARAQALGGRLGRNSSGQLNPAVTVRLWLLRGLPGRDAACPSPPDFPAIRARRAPASGSFREPVWPATESGVAGGNDGLAALGQL